MIVKANWFKHIRILMKSWVMVLRFGTFSIIWLKCFVMQEPAMSKVKRTLQSYGNHKHFQTAVMNGIDIQFWTRRIWKHNEMIFCGVTLLSKDIDWRANIYNWYLQLKLKKGLPFESKISNGRREFGSDENLCSLKGNPQVSLGKLCMVLA
jgi:hypothetical protein